MSSLFKVPITTITKIENHPNAHSLDICTVYGFEIITSRNQYKLGDRVIYIPVDSILSQKIEDIVFPPDSKVKLNKSRVRQIKLRGLASQGLLIEPNSLRSIVNLEYVKDETDVSEMLGITKYEPPAPREPQGPNASGKGRKALAHPDFHKYNGIDNIKWYPSFFKEDQEVIIQEKIHGSHCRAAVLKYKPNTLWKKIKKLLKLTPEYENLYGNNYVDITNAKTYTGYYGKDVYGPVLNRIKAFEKIKPNEIIFGELFGPKIQAGYEYGLKEHDFILFDVKKVLEDGSQIWLDPEQVEMYAFERGFKFVPVLYRGVYNEALAKSLAKGPSVFCPEEPVIEGIVIKSRFNYSVEGNKQCLKMINEDYLDNKKNTDFH